MYQAIEEIVEKEITYGTFAFKAMGTRKNKVITNIELCENSLESLYKVEWKTLFNLSRWAGKFDLVGAIAIRFA